MKRTLFAGMAAFVLTMMGSAAVANPAEIGPTSTASINASAAAAASDRVAPDIVFVKAREAVDVAYIVIAPERVEYAVYMPAMTRAERVTALNPPGLTARTRSRPG